ncbi:MMPL family transporter [Phytohabitans rumicis]|uniref:SSD domain-containing protein n=1 Tax=Phytohabitans rumicis TaxID=1076125 RepID=A0A6V8KWG9_9ACTN|nr:MMPL family transporter [Phytohabitans rumicis]GFJ86741.1 hypothetical protein Prum_003830 [Phytohabitans rumicis]
MNSTLPPLEEIAMIRFITGAGRRHPIAVLVVWLLITVAGFTLGNAVFARMTTTVGTVPGSEAQRGAEALGDAKLAPPVITAVVSGPPASTPAFRTAVEAAVTDLRVIPGVVAVSEPFGPTAPAAPDGRAVVLDVELEHQGDLLANRVADRIRDIGDTAGVTVAVSGGPLTDAEFNEQATSDTRRAEIISAPLLLILLLIVFGSLLAAGMPLLIAMVGVGGTFTALLGLSFVTDVSIYAIQVTTMLAIGLGVDYALLMVSRFREERATVEDFDEALRRATERAGRTIVFSGLTVAVSLASLLVFEDPFLRSIGLAGAAVVVIDMLAAITLLPALLRLFGRRIKPVRRVQGRAVPSPWWHAACSARPCWSRSPSWPGSWCWPCRPPAPAWTPATRSRCRPAARPVNWPTRWPSTSRTWVGRAP